MHAASPSAGGTPTVSAAPGCTDLSDLEARAWFGLLHSYAQLVRALDADLVAAHGLPLNAFEVLMRLSRAEDGQMRMSELARTVSLSLSGLSRLADRLERDDLIERRACASDARGFFAAVTPEGRARLAAAQGDHFSSVRERFLERFSPDELELLGEFWQRVAPHGRC